MFKFWRQKAEVPSLAPGAATDPATCPVSQGSLLDSDTPAIGSTELPAATIPTNASASPAYVPPPPSASLGRSFVQDGFVVVPGVFPPEDVAEFRREAIALFSDNTLPFQSRYSTSAVWREPFRKIFANERFIHTLKQILGDDFVFIPEMALHDSSYPGWHTDTTSPEAKAGHEFHWAPNFLVVNIGIYFGDNDGFGCGLDVVPRSYVRDDQIAIKMRQDNGFPPSHRSPVDPDPFSESSTIRSKAGDIVIFHLRTYHRSSIPNRPAANDAERKLAMFVLAGANNAGTKRYCEWLTEYDTMNKAIREPVSEDFSEYLAQSGLKVL